MSWRAGPHSIVGENLVVKAIRIWSPRKYERGAEYPLRVTAGVQRQGQVALLGGYDQNLLSLNANESRLITGQNALNYPLQPGDVLVAEWDQRPVAGVIVEFQLTRVGSVSEPVVEERRGVIGGRDIERPLFSAHAQDEEAVARLARQINESGVPDVSVPIYLWDVPAGTPYVSLLIPEGHVFAGGGAIEVVPYQVVITQSEEKIWLPDLGEYGRFISTIDAVHILTATLKLLSLGTNTDIKFGLRAHYDADSPIFPGQVVDYWLVEDRVESNNIDIALVMANEFFVRTSVEYEAIVQISGDTNVTAGTDTVDSRASVTQLGSVFAPRGPQGEPGPPGPQGPKGASEFVKLIDTPNSYAGEARRHVRVNDAEIALEYVDEPMRWRGAWAVGDYEKNDVVRDGDWLMVANKDTTGRPAPQPDGNPFWVGELPGTIPAPTINTSPNPVIHFGTRFTSTTGGFLRGFRVYLPDDSGDFTYEVWVASNSGEATQVLAPTIPTAVGFFEIPINTIVASGTVLDLWVVGRAVTQPNTFTATWSVKNTNGDPSSGEAWFQDNATEIRVHHEDSGGTSQQGNLEAVAVGGSLLFAGQEWTITAVDLQADHVRYTLSPNQGRPTEDDRNLTFQWGSTDPIPYPVWANWFIGEPDAEGFFDTEYPPAATDDNFYGADIYVEGAEISPDWDLMSTLGGGGGGGGGGVDTFAALLDTPASYAGEGGKLVAVKGAEDGLEFVVAAAGGAPFVGQAVNNNLIGSLPPTPGTTTVMTTITGLDPAKTYRFFATAGVRQVGNGAGGLISSFNVLEFSGATLVSSNTIGADFTGIQGNNAGISAAGSLSPDGSGNIQIRIREYSGAATPPASQQRHVAYCLWEL